MATVTEKFYPIGSDNTLDLVLTKDGKALSDLSAITRIVVKLGAITIDSNVDVGDIDWTNEQDANGNDKIIIKFRNKITSEISAKIVLTVYDAGNANGIVFISEKSEEQIKLKAHPV